MLPHEISPQLLHRVERARRVVSLCSQVTIRAYDEEALLTEVCRILLDVGDYCMAWIGEAAPGASPLTALAHAGATVAGVRSQLPWTNDVGPRSPTLRALREQRPQVVRTVADPGLRKRRPEAEQPGYAAVCAFPLQFGPYGAGALTIYAREGNAFAPEEMSLLRELSGDLGVGVAVLRAKKANEALEEQLEEAERRYRSLIEHAPVAIAQITPAAKILLANKALADLVGYASPAALCAQPPGELARHLEDAALQRLKALVQAGPPYKPAELRLRRVDGSSLWVEVQARQANVLGEEVFEAFVRDLTPRRAAQLASARLAAVVDASEAAVIGIDLEGVVQTWSRGAEALYGFTEAEAIGQPAKDLYVPAARSASWESLLETLATGKRVQRFETQRSSREKTLCDVSVSANPILDADGKVVGASLLEHDVGERNRARAASAAQENQEKEVRRLQELARLHAEFLGRASHEMNTPLTPILLQVQALLATPGLDARQGVALAIIERNVVRLANLVKDLLLTSNLSSNDLRLKPKDLDVRLLASDAVEAFGAQAQAAQITLTLEAGEALHVFADPDRVMQVLFNALGNALKFTPAGGTVTLRAARREADAIIEVVDTGRGFSQAAAENLFQPFGRLHDRVPGTPPGTGLGLYISKGIVERSGGTMWLHSAGENLGSTLAFTLPRHAVKALRILMVDDDAVALRVAKAILASMDYGVDVVRGGAQAVDRVASGEYDVVLMDVGMPDVDGLEATRRIRLLHLRKPPRILALTAGSTNEERAACFAAGMDDVLVKPLSRGALAHALAASARDRPSRPVPEGARLQSPTPRTRSK